MTTLARYIPYHSGSNKKVQTRVAKCQTTLFLLLLLLLLLFLQEGTKPRGIYRAIHEGDIEGRGENLYSTGTTENVHRPMQVTAPRLRTTAYRCIPRNPTTRSIIYLPALFPSVDHAKSK
ncbi:unnamed protein product [Tuber aestivum]|uniref:Uncharacterized protein n=1 Tax=Tuber aestivum TaxID=59557 RepID=A0A292PM19_9PEZI|nr:unnamed protein product [Tuber aestivum]